MNCLNCQNSISKKGKNYCSRRCWLSSEQFKMMKKERQAEINKKISASHMGLRHTEESRKKMSETRKLIGTKISGSAHWNWNPDRKEQAKRFRSSRLFYGLIGRVLKRTSQKKIGHTDELLGYSAQDLRRHLESLFQDGMSWENHGKGPGKWHLDHIRPICEFPPDTPPSVVNALSNLRPLWEEENLRRTRTRWNRKAKNEF